MPDTSPPLDPQLADLAKGLGIDPATITPEQTQKVTAITLAIGVLNEAKVSYTFFTSPDAPSEDMKTLASHRMSYSKDLETIGKETTLVRQAFTWAALRTLSVGMRGSLVLIDVKGVPLCAFNQGAIKQIGVPSDTPVVEPVVMT
jgi:hypothetical protein